MCTHQQIIVGRRCGVPGCQDRVEAQWFVAAGWHSWGRQITLSLFELTKRPSSEDRKQLHLALLTFCSSQRSCPSGHHFLSSCCSFYSFKSCVPVTSLTLSTCFSYLSFFQIQPESNRMASVYTWPESCCQRDVTEIYQCVIFFRSQNHLRELKRTKYRHTIKNTSP